MGALGRTVTAGLGLVLILVSAFWTLDVFWLGVGVGLSAGHS